MATGVSFENFTGHVVDVDWPAVVAGVTIYDEWQSPPSETSPATAGYRTTEITDAYSLSRIYDGGSSNIRGLHGEFLAAAGGEALQPPSWGWQATCFHVEHHDVGSCAK